VRFAQIVTITLQLGGRAANLHRQNYSRPNFARFALLRRRSGRALPEMFRAWLRLLPR